jgi:putative flippase GtrA
MDSTLKLMRPKLARLTPRIAIRSASIGVVATFVDLLSLAIAIEVCHASPTAANIPALSFGVLAQFLGNKIFAFEDRSPAWGAQGALFFLVEAIAFGLNTVLFDRLIAGTGLPYIAVRLMVTTGVYFGFSLPLWSYIFRASTERGVASCRSSS